MPELKVLNHGEKAVLLLDGEELIGAKQNRVLNLSILVPPHSSRTIPVSCVEAGRWSRSSARFSSAPRAHYAEGRRAKMQQVTLPCAPRARGRRISARCGPASRKDVASRVAVRDGGDVGHVRGPQQPLEDFVSAFQAMDGQVGAMFLVNGRPGGVELFDAPATWKKLSPKLVRSYALDAIDRSREPSAPVEPMPARALIDAVRSSDASVFDAVGEGSDVRLTGTDVGGAALVARGRTIHLSAFVTA